MDERKPERKCIWRGVMSNIKEAKAHVMLCNYDLHCIDVLLASCVTMQVMRQKKSPKIYPYLQESYSGYTWSPDILPSMPLITEKFHCCGNGCTTVGPMKYKHCEVSFKV